MIYFFVILNENKNKNKKIIKNYGTLKHIKITPKQTLN